MKIVLGIILSLLICTVAACNNDAEKTVGSSNSNFKVEKLFTDDNGYTVMRFMDGGSFHYYVVGGKGQTESKIGKSSYETIPTEKP